MKHKKIAVVAEYLVWLALGVLIFFGMLSAVFGATIYTDPGVTYRPSTADFSAMSINVPNYWFRGGNGTTYDYVNYGLDAITTTNVNTPGLSEGNTAPGQIGLATDGVNDCVSAGTGLTITADKLTIMVWMRAGAQSLAYAGLAGKMRDGATGEYALMRQSSLTTARMEVLNAAGTSGVALTSSSPYDGGVHHICGTYAGDSVRVFFDGVQEGKGVLTGNVKVATNTFLIGSYDAAGNLSDVTSRAYVGSIWDVMVWKNESLTSSQITALYAFMNPTGASGEPYPSLQAANWEGSAGDTILMADGRYLEMASITKAFDYIGASNTAFGNWPEFYGTDLPAAAGTTGMTVSADNEVGFLSFRGYYAASNIGLQGTATSDGSLFHHLEFDSCLTAVNFVGQCTADSLVNCTIDEASLGSSTGISWSTNPGAATSVYVINTIVVNGTTGITESLANATFANSYSDFYNNTTAYGGSCAAGTGDIAVIPRFKAPNDYRPYAAALRSGTAIHVSWTWIGAWQVLTDEGGSSAQLAKWGRSNRWGREEE